MAETVLPGAMEHVLVDVPDHVLQTAVELALEAVVLPVPQDVPMSVQVVVSEPVPPVVKVIVE